MEKAILHLLLVLGSLIDTNHSYNHDWWSQGMILPLAIFPGMSLYFLFCLRYLLHYTLNQSPSEPLFVLRRSGLGTSLNPQILWVISLVS